MAKRKFKLLGSGRVRSTVGNIIIVTEPGETILIDEKDINYNYFVDSRRWETISHLDVKKDDLADDGVRNYSNEPMKNEKGRYTKKKEGD